MVRVPPPPADLASRHTPTGPTRDWLRLWGPVAALMAAIFIVSSMSEPPAPDSVGDKNLHAIVYGLLSGLALRAFAGGRWRGVTRATVGLAVTLATLYGVSDELHQRLVPARSAEVWDVVADALGATVAALAAWGWSIIRTPRGGARQLQE